jgi:hypothetical protein
MIEKKVMAMILIAIMSVAGDITYLSVTGVFRTIVLVVTLAVMTFLFIDAVRP